MGKSDRRKTWFPGIGSNVPLIHKIENLDESVIKKVRISENKLNHQEKLEKMKSIIGTISTDLSQIIFESKSKNQIFASEIKDMKKFFNSEAQIQVKQQNYLESELSAASRIYEEEINSLQKATISNIRRSNKKMQNFTLKKKN